MRTFLIWLGWIVLGGVIAVGVFSGYCLGVLGKDAEKAESWLETLLNESVDL